MTKTTKAARAFPATKTDAGGTAIWISHDRYGFVSKLAERRDITRFALINEIVDHYVDTVLLGGKS